MVSLDISRLRANVAAVRLEMDAALQRAGRALGDVKMVAVTKTVETETALACFKEGVADLAENRVQLLLKKQEEIAKNAPEIIPRWHLIGNLQTKKINQILGKITLFHGLDSVALAQELETRATKQSLRMEALLEVNLSGEATKHGFSEEALLREAGFIKQLKFLKIKGLMTMAPLGEAPDKIRALFVRCRELRNRLQLFLDQELPELSMGMSQDYPIAIEEGATLVRIGTKLFEGVQGI